MIQHLDEAQDLITISILWAQQLLIGSFIYFFIILTKSLFNVEITK